MAPHDLSTTRLSEHTPRSRGCFIGSARSSKPRAHRQRRLRGDRTMCEGRSRRRASDRARPAREQKGDSRREGRIKEAKEAAAKARSICGLAARAHQHEKWLALARGAGRSSSVGTAVGYTGRLGVTSPRPEPMPRVHGRLRCRPRHRRGVPARDRELRWRSEHLRDRHHEQPGALRRLRPRLPRRRVHPWLV